MSMRSFRIAVAAIASVLCGCAQLDVSVHVLDRERIPVEKRLESNVWLEAQRYASEVATGFYPRLEATLVRELDAVVDMLITTGVVTDPSVRAELGRDIRNSARERISKARERSEEGMRLYESVRDPGAPDRTAVLERALAALQSGRVQVQNIATTTKNDLAQLARSNPAAAPAAVDKSLVAIAGAFEKTSKLAQARHPLFGGETLFNDPLAAWVVTADRDAWKGSFNQSYGAGYFGNVDVAVKMEADGVFTLKGVRLDASKTTEATFAVIRQTLNVAAAGVGWPIAKTTAPQTAPASTDAAPDTPDVSSGLVADAKESTAKERMQREQAQYALSAVLDVVVRNAAQIGAGDAQRKQSIEQIKTVYGAYKPLIEVAQKDGGTP
jgi:hypothetical protein